MIEKDISCGVSFFFYPVLFIFAVLIRTVNETTTMIEEILAYNKHFVEKKGYEEYITNKYPDKKIAILSCMDTRLTALLPAALGIKNGDVKMIKNAGGVISHPFGSVVRSLLVAIFELGVEEIMVIAIPIAEPVICTAKKCLKK